MLERGKVIFDVERIHISVLCPWGHQRWYHAAHISHDSDAEGIVPRYLQSANKKRVYFIAWWVIWRLTRVHNDVMMMSLMCSYIKWCHCVLLTWLNNCIWPSNPPISTQATLPHLASFPAWAERAWEWGYTTPCSIVNQRFIYHMCTHYCKALPSFLSLAIGRGEPGNEATPPLYQYIPWVIVWQQS